MLLRRCKFTYSNTLIYSKQIIGNRDPKLASKDSMRSFYGVDRMDNAYFISENFSEALLERDYLFTGSSSLP